jgi:Carboxypeptidase regulatory-like domain
MNRVFRLLVTCCMACCCSLLQAQSGALARVSGTVTDTNGAVIPGATVQVRETNTGISRTTTTGSEGNYTFPDLPTGSYSLRTERQGFSAFNQTGIVLEVGSSPTVNIKLQVGNVTEQVTVVANAAIVEAQSTTLGQVVTHQEVLNIPLNARDPMQLLTLAPGAVVANSGVVGNYNGPWQYPTPYTVAFSGTDPGAGNYMLDGGNGNSPYSNGAYPLPFPDALQEFKVETNAVPARYGMHSAATVNAITRSGTNAFHGNVFEFVRNYIFNARNPFVGTRDNLKRNQFGGTIGGPIMKENLFFFAAYQQTIVRSTTYNTAFIPTIAELNGDFTAATSAACNSGKAVKLGGPFAGSTTISPSAFSVPSVTLAKLLPQTSDPCGQVTYGTKTATNAPSIIGRGDFHISQKHTIFGRYYYAGYTLPPDATSYLTLNQADQQLRYQTGTMGDTYIVTSSIVNSFHANLNRAFNYKAFDPGVTTPSDLGVADFYNPLPNYINLTVNNFFNVKGGTALTPAQFNNTVFQFSDDVDFVKGKHSFSFGGNYVRFMTNLQSPVYLNGSFTFSNQATGFAMSDYLLGDLFSFQQGNIVSGHARKNYLGLYAQDSWRITPKLTANYGVRWEPFLPVYSKDGQGEHFDFNNFNNGVQSKVYVNAPAGLQFPGDYPGYGNSYLPTYTHFEPRVGFSYDPRGKGLEVIRASYGLFYDFEALQDNQATLQSPPWADTITRNAPSGGFSAPWAGFSYNGKPGNPYPIISSSNFVFPTGGIYETTPSLNVHAPNLQQWNVSFQKQFREDWSLTTTYIGNKGTHLWTGNELNPATYIPGTCGASPCSTSANVTARRLLTQLNPTVGPYYASIVENQDNATSTYNAGIVSLQRRLKSNFSLLLNYTFSHCIDTGETTAILVTSAFRNDLSAEVGNCSFDHRHQLTLTGILRAPQFSSGFAKIVASNWQLAPLFSYLSGDWLTVTTGSDTALMGIASGQRPNIVGNPNISRSHLKTGYGFQYFNPAAYSIPTVTPGFTGNIIDSGNGPINVGPLGNVGRSTLEGPGNSDLDVALSRDFQIEKWGQLQVRAEAFNLFNWTRLYDPTTAMNSPSFGQSIAPTSTSTPGYSTAQDPRILQFAMKFTF